MGTFLVGKSKYEMKLLVDELKERMKMQYYADKKIS